MDSRRLRVSPALVVAGVALLFALGGSAFAIGQKAAAPQQRCQNGAVRALAVVTGIPRQGIENLPTIHGQPAGVQPPLQLHRSLRPGEACREWAVGRALPRHLGSELPRQQPVARRQAASRASRSPDGGYRVSLRGVGTQDNFLPPMNVPVPRRHRSERTESPTGTGSGRSPGASPRAAIVRLVLLGGQPTRIVKLGPLLAVAAVFALLAGTAGATHERRSPAQLVRVAVPTACRFRASRKQRSRPERARRPRLRRRRRSLAG